MKRTKFITEEIENIKNCAFGKEAARKLELALETDFPFTVIEDDVEIDYTVEIDFRDEKEMVFNIINESNEPIVSWIDYLNELVRDLNSLIY